MSALLASEVCLLRRCDRDRIRLPAAGPGQANLKQLRLHTDTANQNQGAEYAVSITFGVVGLGARGKAVYGDVKRMDWLD